MKSNTNPKLEAFYETMYEGSLVGAGFHVYAVWNYVLTKTRRGVVNLNPELLAVIFTGHQEYLPAVETAIQFLCVGTDPKLIPRGGYQYKVANWEAYRKNRYH